MDPKRKADDYHGMALYLRASKDVPVNGQRVLKFDLTFEETLKLSVAVQSCAMSLNEWNRRESTERIWACVFLSTHTARPLPNR